MPDKHRIETGAITLSSVDNDTLEPKRQYVNVVKQPKLKQ